MSAKSPAGRYAIVGIGCRFPGGADSADAFWQLLAEGRDAIGEVPEDRPDWRALYDPDPAAIGRIYARLGGFIDGIDRFDARFFGISPREAMHIDPQHRFLLEVVWQAFEDARIPLDRLAGSDTGVFVGISTHDYSDVQMYPQYHDRIGPHSNSGCATSIAANRISFTYDLRGPSVAVDTACSSALTAAHLACTALDAGDCGLAVVGGVQLLLRPELTMGFCRATMLSVDGHCKAFDAAGNGYVRSEGAGVVVLKPLERALADGDPIHAVILGSAINQDGRTSSLTIPNEVSQQAMLRSSLARAGIAPAAVQYVEAHGPGTAVGDPIEARAIGAVFGEDRPAEDPLRIGSVKTNIGHLEAGSGIAGLIKAALAIRHRQIPASLHFNTWNPAIDPVALKLRVVTELEAWPESAEGPIAAINSFGFGGANASVVLGAAPASPAAAVANLPERAEILAISAQTAESLRSLALSYSDLVLNGDTSLPALCGAAALGRSHHDDRIAIVATGRAAFADAIDAAVAGDNAANVARGRAAGGAAHKLAFVFSGMGPQWWGMGRQLLDREPVFAAMMARCDAALRPHSGWSLIDEFRADEAASRIAHPQLAQVSNFALQVSLAALWAHWGITPGAVLGHSGGAMAAAYTAGIHSLDEAIWLAFHRSSMQGRDSNAGEMLAVGLPAAEAEALIAGHEDRISIAAINGPATTTLSGDGEVLRTLAAALTARQVFARMLTVTIAYHSPRMDPIRDEFLETVQDLAARSATIPFVSDTAGTWEDGAGCDAAYWWRAIRSPVRFADSIGTLAAAGYTGFVEVSPHPVLAASIGDCLRGLGTTGLVVPSLRRNEDERATMLRSLATLYAHGAEPTWDALYARDTSVALPLYPFQRDRHWFDPDEGGAQQAIGEADANPLLGQRMPGAQPLWEARLDVPALGYIGDHLVQEAVVVPGAAYVTMALAAAQRLDPKGGASLRDISFQRPLIVGDGRPRAQIAFDADGTGFSIFSRADGRTGWMRHAQGRVSRGATADPAPRDLAALAGRMGPAKDIPSFYAAVARRGLVYGPAFTGITTLRTCGSEALATVGPIAGLTVDADSIHPGLLDAAFQVLIAIADTIQPDDSRTFLPVAIEEVRLCRPAGGRFHVHCRLDALAETAARASFEILDDDGQLLLGIAGLKARLIESAGGEADLASQCLYEYRWEAKPLIIHDAAPRRDGLLRADADFAAGMRAAAEAIERATGWSRYYAEAEPILSDVAAAHVLAALATLEPNPFSLNRHPGEVRGPAGTAALDPGFRRGDGDAGESSGPIAGVAIGDVVDAATIAQIRDSEPSGGRWLDRLLGLLRDTGCIAAAGDGWRVMRIPDAADLAERLPRHEVGLVLLAEAGRTLGPALAGKSAGRDAVFTAESLPLLTRFYRDAPESDHYNRVLAAALQRLIAGSSHAGTLRILEIGAGTGGATTALLDILPQDRTRYLFTDTAALLIDAARERFAATGCLETRLLDITRDTEAQGFAPGAFDLIVAANVVHATPDIAATLARLQALLAPGGTLAMIEITRHPPWLDVVFGQTRGWWMFEDRALRPEHPLLESAQWRRQLGESGYTDIWMSEEPAAIGEAAQTVILARAPARAAPAAPWLILGEADGPATRVAAAIERLGATTIVDPDEAIVSRQLDAGIAPAGVIDMRSIAAFDGFAAAQAGGVFRTLSLARRLLARADLPAFPVWLVTADAAQLPGMPADALQAPIWGFGRTLLKEHPEIPLRMADIGHAAGDAEIAALVREITEHDRDEEIGFIGPTRYVRRLRRADAAPPQRRLADQPLAWCAEIGIAGSLGSLRLREFRPLPLGPHEVRIAVEAASLNFRDIVLAMANIQGLEEENSTGQQRLGSDCAGRVLAVGSAVTRFAPGDAVMGMAPASHASIAVASEQCLIHKPATLSFAEAAALPTVFLTAWYTLTRLARIRRGDRVLIHAATGGVGLAAVQIARDAGAEIFATAGSDAKRDHLRALGIRHVMDSRALDFADQIRVATDGAGVDIVLNSLTGEAVERGIACLAPYGRFIEIGKVDIYANNALPLGGFRRNLSYTAFDLDRLTVDQRDLVEELMGELAEAFASGRFQPLPTEIFPMARIEDGFRLMAQGRHIGKIVLTAGDQPPALPVTGGIDCLLRGDGSYLITGGLGGFGLAVAEHLATGSPGAIVLMGRSPPDGAAALRIERMRQAGTRVEVMTGDVTSLADIDAVLGRIAGELPPLRGIFHGAMVLDDGRVAAMDDAALERVMAPKALGAWHLHQRTLALPLDHFVMFSSITSPLGNPLQANYSAASAYLDALAHQRQAAGLPALTINWGVLAGAGYVAQRPELQRFLDQQGYLAFAPRQALAALEIAMRRTVPQIMAARIDWRQLASYSARTAASPRIADLIPAADSEGARPAVSSEIAAALAAAAPDKRAGLIEAFLIRTLGRVLGMAADKIDAETPFAGYGLDSLLSVEFMVVLSTELDFEMPVIALLDDMSARKLGALILADLGGRAATVLPSASVPIETTRHPGESRGPAVTAALDPGVRRGDGEAPVIASAAAVAEAKPSPAPAGDQSWTPLQKTARAISKASLAAFGRVDVCGEENLPAGPFILAVNHLSMADVPLALAVMPRRTIILANAKLKGSWLLDRLVGGVGQAIFVPKTGDIAPALEEALQVLRGGGIIALAPEGTRNRAGLGRGETGVAWLAQHAGLPVVPYAAWGQEGWRGRFRRFGRLEIGVRIGAPLAPPPAGDIGLRDYTDRVMRAIAELLPEDYRGVYADREAAE